MMKYLLFIAMLAVLSATTFAGIQSAQVTVSALKYEPAPAEPGSYIDVYLKIQNEGLTTEDFTIKAAPEYPFSLSETESEVKEIGRIPAGEDATVIFRIDVDLGARSEEKNLTFYYKYQKQPNWVKFEYPISIQTQDVSLTIEEYNVTPTVVRPGEQAKISIVLKNNGLIGIKNIDVTISPDLDTNKFSIVGSGTTKRVSNIWPEERKLITFDVVADTTATPKVYTIPISMNFSDVRNRAKTADGTLTLLVGALPEVRASIDKTTITAENLQGSATLKIINSGITDMKYVNVLLQQSDDYTILSPSAEEYVGNLDSDDFETVEFSIKSNTKNPVLKFSVNFKDPYNKDYVVSYSLPLQVRSEKELGKKTNKTLILLGIIVFLLIAYIIYLRRKKR